MKSVVNPEIQKLLILQDHEQDLRRLQQLLQAIPIDIKRLQGTIQAEEKTVAEAKANLQHLEVRRNDLDNRVNAAQEQILRYKTQQLQVKKNEEYQALIHEIEGLQNKILHWEEEEISLMIEIDDQTATYQNQKTELASSSQKIQKEISVLQKRAEDLNNRIQQATLLLQETQQDVHPNYLKAYRPIAARMKLPVVVGLKNQKCRGCHLRVSNELLEKARKGATLTNCHNCGRLIYYAS